MVPSIFDVKWVSTLSPSSKYDQSIRVLIIERCDTTATGDGVIVAIVSHENCSASAKSGLRKSNAVKVDMLTNFGPDRIGIKVAFNQHAINSRLNR